jgi:hypothetical protein
MNPFYSSIVSSLVEVVTTHPLDVLKTKHQIDKSFNFKSLWNMPFKQKYAGFSKRFLGVVPIRSTFLFSQDFIKDRIKTNNTIVKDLSVIFGASLCQTLADTPIEISKINTINNSNINVFSYRGFLPHYTRNLIFMAGVYEAKKLSTNNYNVAIYGAIGGFVGSYLSHPFDTLKTFKQSGSNQKLTMENAFRGVHVRATMGFINMLISLFIYENLKNMNISL